MIKYFSIAAVLSFFLFASSAGATPNQTPTSGTITFYSAGWAAESVRIQRTGAFYNPEGCASADGYVTDPTINGSKLYNTTLMSAFLAGKPIQLIVDGCYSQRPRIIGVYVFP